MSLADILQLRFPEPLNNVVLIPAQHHSIGPGCPHTLLIMPIKIVSETYGSRQGLMCQLNQLLQRRRQLLSISSESLNALLTQRLGTYAGKTKVVRVCYKQCPGSNS